MNFQDLIKKLKQFPLATIAGGVGLILLVILVFRFGRVFALEAEVTELEDRLGRMARNAANAAGIDDHIARLTDINERIDKRIINPTTKASNLDYFYSLERPSGVHVLSVSQRDVPPEDQKKPEKPKGTPKPEIYQPLEFEIAISGTFPDIVRYLDLVGRDRYFVRINSLSLAEAQSLSGSLNASILVSVLAEKPNAEAGSGGRS